MRGNERNKFVGENEGVVSFRDEDLLAFADASHDRNPLHLSRDYARKTPYGQPVVFGILGALACLPRLAPVPGEIISALDLRFLSPMFAGIEYRIEANVPASGKRVVRLNDGRRAALQVTATFEPGARPVIAEGTPQAPSREARSTAPERLACGTTVSGGYEPDWHRLHPLLIGLGLSLGAVDPSLLAALLWSSYLVGMELPGRQALFSRLTLDLHGHKRFAPFFEYEARVRSFDPRFNRLVTDGLLQADGQAVARATIESLIRPESPRPGLRSSRETGSGLCGDKVSLVIGGSRGLGAAIVLALVREGAHVYVNFHRSAAEAEQLREQVADLPGGVTLVQGDGGNLKRCEEIRHTIINEHGRLDLLVCGAAPAVLPLRIEASAVERINQFIAESIRLVTVPLAVFLDSLSASTGQAAVISSEYVHTLPVDLPHYVAGKAAIEALTMMAARQYPSVSYAVVRPPKLATDLSSSPFAFETALEAEIVAEVLVSRLSDGTTRNSVLAVDISPDGSVRTESIMTGPGR